MKISQELISILTPKEIKIVTGLANGLLYKEIAETEAVTIDTVKKHIKNIYRKLDVRNRTEAVNKYYEYSMK